MELHIMGATLTEQAVKGNVTVCNWNTLLLSSAHKYDYICQVELRECPWSQHRHFLLQTFPIIAENSPIHSKWEGKNKSFWYYMPNLEHLLYNWLHFLRTRFKVSESKPVVHCLSVMNSWEQKYPKDRKGVNLSQLYFRCYYYGYSSHNWLTRSLARSLVSAIFLLFFFFNNLDMLV